MPYDNYLILDIISVMCNIGHMMGVDKGFISMNAMTSYALRVQD